MTTMTSPPEPAPVAHDERGYRFRWQVMAVVILADVMDLLDATVANLAGPSIRRDIGGGESTLQWILAAYTLTFAVGLVTSARLGDLIGRRRMFLVGMIGFTVASLLCGLAPSAGLLIAARALQGLFGATMIPQGLAMVKASFREEDLQKAFIPFGPVMGLAAVLGPILAGFLIDADLLGSGWRAIFWINVPVGLVASWLAVRYLPRTLRPERGARLDWRGSLLLTGASVLLIYPLVQGREQGWPAWMFAMLAGSAVMFAAFVASERRSSHPVIEPSLFRRPPFVGGLVFLGAFFTAMSGFNLVANLYVQYGMGYSPMDTGLTMIPMALGISVGAAASGAVLGPRFGRRVLHGGVLAAAAGLLMMWWTVGHQGLATTGWQLAPSFVVMGLGMGMVFAPLFDIILASLSDREVGTGSGLLNAVQQFCGALGVAVLGSAFFHWLPGHGMATSLRWLILLSIGCFAISFAVAFVLPRRPRPDPAAA
ncbi:MFS transporter [Nocardioides terrisoli]|uniref:MFS transporter n=1 Tax=Nocardioides terrisoli TaxID=3388267 RepID=UPI00287BBBAC|nr:MFS transporter [Nocardioides marmorisolisilvae]